MRDKYFVISDTHGLLRPKALELLKDADLIIHTGDIGSPEVLQGLRGLAPLVAVRGNVDTGEWARDLPGKEIIDIDGKCVYLLHNIEALDLVPEAAGINAVVYGHSHQPIVYKKKGVLYLNPGSAGPRRFNLPVSMARLTITGERIEGEVIFLD